MEETIRIRREVGRRLQQIRGNRDQRSFAEAIDSVQQTISKYERGEIPRSWLFLARLHAEEGVDLNQLLADGVGAVEEGGNGRGGEQGSNGRERPAYAAAGSGFTG